MDWLQQGFQSLLASIFQLDSNHMQAQTVLSVRLFITAHQHHVTNEFLYAIPVPNLQPNLPLLWANECEGIRTVRNERYIVQSEHNTGTAISEMMQKPFSFWQNKNVEQKRKDKKKVSKLACTFWWSWA